MNSHEYYNSTIRCKNYEYKQIQQLLNDWKAENNITERCVVHHRDDTEETRKYNEKHYERWGFNEDGTFEYGKYILFMIASDHIQYHHKGEKHPLYGKHHSEETKEKISTALSGTNIGDKNPNYGKKLSDETKYKIHLANKGRRHSDEAKAKMSIVNKGKKVSNETKEKMSQIAKERMQIISDAYKKYKLEGGTLTWLEFMKQYYK